MVALLVPAIPPAMAYADPTQGASARLQTPTEDAGKSGGDRAFIVMPIPLSDPTIGTGLGLGGMALYNRDANGRPWTTGVGGFYTDTDSWAALLFHKSAFANDRYRLTAALGYGDFNLDFYGIGSEAGERGRSIGINQKGAFALAELLAGVQPNLYLGLRYRGMALKTAVDLSNTPFPDLIPPDIELKSNISQLGLAGEYDTRDSEFGPRHGVYATGQWLFADEGFGSDFEYDRASLALNAYHALGPDTTLALRASACWAGDGAPFFDLCSFGTQNDLRGYPAGQFRDHAMHAVQAEVRQHLFGRVGAAVFMGAGQVARGFDDLDTDVLPAVGFGLRIEASKEYRVNLSIDYAAGDGSSGLYFYIGEAF